MDINVSVISGRLGRDPEIIYLQNGTPLADLSVATSYSVKKNGEWESKTMWHNVKIFGKIVESYVSKFKKGDVVIIEGTLRQDTWEDKTTGAKRYKTYILGNRISGVFSDSGQAGATQQQTTAQAPTQPTQAPQQTAQAQQAVPVNQPVQMPPTQPAQPQPQYEDDLPF